MYIYRFLIIYILSNIFALSGEINCGNPYTIVLNGEMNHETHGYAIRWTEHMELEKVNKSGSINGRWKITKWVIHTTMPFASPVSMERDYDFDIPKSGGMHGRFHLSLHGRETVQVLTRSTLYLDIENNRIGFKKSNLWIGKIEGKKATLQFFNPEQMKKRGFQLQQSGVNDFPSTRLVGTVNGKDGIGKKRIKIVFVGKTRNNAIYGFVNKTAVLAAVVTSTDPLPEGYWDWSVEPIEGVTADFIENGSSRVYIRLEGIPKYNDLFGKHKVRVKYHSTDRQCLGEAEATFKLFYRAFAFNHPSSSASEREEPNWLYYWKQTPAARPHGDSVRLVYGGRFECNCGMKNVVACYQSKSFNKLLYVCNLISEEFGGKMQITYPLLDRRKEKPLLGWRTTRYIDTFAVSLIHEYQHYLDEMRWQRGKSDAQIAMEDRDKDDIPDSEEPGLGFDPHLKQTYKPEYPDENGTSVPLDVKTDEEWIAYEAMRSYQPGTFNKYDWGCPGAQIDDALCK